MAVLEAFPLLPTLVSPTTLRHMSTSLQRFSTAMVNTANIHV